MPTNVRRERIGPEAYEAWVDAHVPDAGMPWDELYALVANRLTWANLVLVEIDIAEAVEL